MSDKITTGKYTDSEGKTAECVCLPLSTPLLASIAINGKRIYINYEKITYNEADEIEKIEPFAYEIQSPEKEEILNSVLVNGSSIFSGMKEKIVKSIKEMQNIG